MQKQQHVSVDKLFDYDDETAYREMLREELAKNWANGFCRMPDLVHQDRTLSPKAKIVYEQLLSYMWFESDHCWPSQQTLADATGYSRRTVIRACKELYERGYIEKWRRGQGYTNYYFINPLTFPQTFRRTERQPVESMILSASAPELREDVTSCPPRSIDEALAMCQTVTSRSDKVSHPEVTEWHPKQTKEKQIHEKERSSNPSTAQKGMDFPVASGTTGNEQQHEESCAADALHQKTHTIEREQQSALQQWRDTYYANKAAPEAQERHSATNTKTNEPVRSSKQANSSSRSCSQGNAPESAKQAYDANLRQMQQQVIAQATGIPQSHLEEMGIAQDRKRAIPEFIKAIIDRFSRELGDNTWCIKSNITHAAKLYFFALDHIKDAQDDPQVFFAELLYEAKQAAYKVINIRYHNDQGRPNRIPVFFTCLENRFELSDDELAYIRSDEPLFESAQVR